MQTFEEWCAETKDRGGTREEYDRLVELERREKRPKKSEECEGCPLYDCQGPVPSELNGVADWNLTGDTDVLFVSEAPGRVEIERNRPMINPRGAGAILRQSLKQTGIKFFGVMNVWRCKPPANKLPEGEVPGEFCFAPNTPILMSDFTWKPISDVCVGDYVVGVGSGSVQLSGKFLSTRVTEVFRRNAPTVRVTHDRGTFVCTPNHPFFSGEGTCRSGYWTAVSELNGKRLKFVGLPPQNTSEFNRGWLAGYLDGDGHFGEHFDGSAWHYQVSVRSKDIELIDNTIDLASYFGFEFHRYSGGTNKAGNSEFVAELVKGDRKETRLELQHELRNLLYELPESDDYKRGWLAGFYDAEGSPYVKRAWGVGIRFSQNLGAELDKLRRYASDCGFHYFQGSPKVHPENVNLTIMNALRFYIECPNILTRKRVLRCNLAEVENIAQLDIESNGMSEVCNLSTECENYVADGFVVHNCKRKFDEELFKWNQKITVALGAVGLNKLTTSQMSITQVQGRVFTVNYNDRDLLLMAALHPAFLLRQRSWWRDWELGFDKLKHYLDTGTLNYIPLSERIVHQAKSTVDALAFVKILRTYKTIACDIETTSFNMPWEGGTIISVAFAVSSTEAYAIPYRFVTGTLFDGIKSLLEDVSIRWLWYNGPYDVQFFWRENIHARIDGDAMLEMHLLDERNNVHSLKRDAGVWLNQIDWEEGIKKYKIPKNKDESTQQMWRQIPEDELLEYNGQDTTHTIHLSSVAREQLGTDLCEYEDTILVPTYNMLARARYVGIRMDLYRIKELHDLFTPIMEEITQRLVEISGDLLFNPNSPPQKLALLRKRGLNVNDTQKGTLEQFEGDEAVDAMLEWSEVQKMNSTYVEGIVDDISDDLRVHPDWRIPTETGRPRCSDPNILGIPRKAEEDEHRWKRRIKEQFVADKGTLLMHIDRKQSEIRCACFLSGDEVLAAILRSGRDIHGEVASLMYGEGWTHEQRVRAKMVVFGLIYNREAPSLARQLKCSVREAQRMINTFFEQMPRLLEWKKEIMKEALENGELTSWLGRKRRFGLITWENAKDVRNEAVNFGPSSLSADLNFLSCNDTLREYGRYGVEVLAPIHDAGLIRFPKNSQSLIKEIEGTWLEVAPKILHTDLPFPVDITIGERWSDL